ncbi:MAG: EamA family transporter [Pseudomonadota bacterium]
MKSGSGQAGTIEIALLLTLATIWSSSFGFIKVAVETVPPISVTAGRLLLATVIVVIYARLRGHRFPDEPGLWLKFFLIGLFGNALPFTLIGWGEESIDSGLAAILMAVMPIATLVLAHFFAEDERMNPARITGVTFGFAGVLVLIGPDALGGMGDNAIRQTAVAGGAACYAVATVIARRLPKMPTSLSSAGALTAAVVFILPMSLIFDRPWALSPSADSVWSVIMLGLFPTALAAILYFTLLRRTGANFIALNNYLIPCLGVIWGIIFLDELLHWRAVLALGIILTGVAFTRIGMRKAGP